MRYLILFLTLVVLAGCVKHLTLAEMHAEAQDICNKRAMEDPNYAYTQCFESEVERLRAAHRGPCLSDEIFCDDWGSLIDRTSDCDPGKESCT